MRHAPKSLQHVLQPGRRSDCYGRQKRKSANGENLKKRLGRNAQKRLKNRQRRVKRFL